MNYKIERVEALSLGTSAQTVKVQGLAFLLQNNSESAVVYFKEKRYDGAAVTSADGYALGPGKGTGVPMEALELSLVSDTADTDVRVLILDLE